MSLEEVSAWCQEFNISSFIETSAKSATNIDEAFELAVKQWRKMERLSEREMREQGDTIDLMRTIPMAANAKRNCCFTSNNSRENSLHRGENDL